SYNAATGTLSFTDSTIAFANLVGDTSTDPAFASDPIMGAKMHLTNMPLVGPSGSGFLFTGGRFTITNGSTTYLTADIPDLLLDDTWLVRYGLNFYCPLTL